MQEQTAKGLREKLLAGEITSAELTEQYLAKIAAEDAAYHAYNTVNEAAKTRAAEVDRQLMAGLNTPLAGVPIAVKDNIATEDMPTTCSSKILQGFISPYNATVIDKLADAGAVLLGKTNMDEFAMGSTTETSYTGVTKNPWNTAKVPGGSSGGSAAAVAAGLAPVALGSDTGGSIRQPCAYCGLTGIKPTYGAVSRYGLLAYGSSLDQIGPIAHTAADCAAVLQVIAGHDEKDSTSAKNVNFDFSGALNDNIVGKRIGLPRNYLGEGLNAEIRAAILAAAEQFAALGAEIEEFEMPMMDYAVPAYYIIASAEASSNLSRYDGIKYGYHPESFSDLEDLYLSARSEGFGLEVKRRVMLGTFALSSGYYDAYYQKALKVRALIRQAFDAAFGKYDAILSPVAPTTAPNLGESLSDPLAMYLSDIYTVAVNLVGIPAIALPCGFDAAGMPIGMQLLGAVWSDDKLVNLAHAYQMHTDWHEYVPTHKEAK
ncbi:MAG TPA: Asp-tRNA(Asn)/Glu-tRNA(Gln) amidotransferase subunit GatA [Candidatus Avidehalobacter gallistercoris]|uniref:Glutamyl-tRNA(Gln) amidotransferase subunit A n=1 Tax=Candidatus Avidehalobacter gallistercoris TaxID=2840694 RepID=A0A9D1HIZ8_9FIRM|nr:Asp-tRNA(Asn)/Glu-tRNA(Gln) amidotransferase subunit GatA [Candidatus Avidehalobacter gallistercoris]